MPKLSIKTRVVLGLVGLLISLLMVASYFDVVPDREGAVREGRTALAEVIALHCTALVMRGEILRLESDFNMMAERNPDLLSLALRRENGRTLVAVGDHDDFWIKMTGEYSKDSQVKVPIWTGQVKWGQLELRFKALKANGIWGVVDTPIIRLMLFMGVLCFIIFYIYLGKVLRQLDPSKAVPGRVRSALDTLAEGLLVIDHKEQIVLANKSFAKLLDTSPDKLLGRLAGELPWLDTEDNKINKHQRPWIQAIDSGQAQKNRLLRIRKSKGAWMTFNVNSSPVLGSGGKYAGVLVSFDDVTELEKKEIELRKSKQIAETASKAKSEFLANMSHEIRTPMNAILGFTEVLKRDYSQNRQESLKHLNTISSSGKNLLELINDILDLSKIESGRLELEEAWIEPHKIIHEVLQLLRVAAHDKGIELHFEAESALPEKIKTDPTRFRQIIYNLVGNAVKFTLQGHVTVSCSYIKNKNASRLLIEIIDTGIGIDKDKLESIFDSFSQSDSTTKRQFGGTGLGLSISRRFARALGGDISVTSEIGKGSTFTIRVATGNLHNILFLQPEEAKEIPQDFYQSEQHRWQIPDANVLIVDDGAETRELVKIFLEDTGLKVDEAKNGKHGVEKAIANSYDVILMDVQMPVMDGFTAVKKIRAHGLKMPVIALTANAMKGFKEKCLNAGYSDYFTKPIDFEQFTEMMAGLLNGRQVPVNAEASNKCSSLDISEEDGNGNDSAPPIYSRLPSDNTLFKKVIVRFAERLDTELENLNQAECRGDYADIAAIAHWLKGAGGTVGFDNFTEPASHLEALAKNGHDKVKVAEIIAELNAMATRLVIPDVDVSVSPLSAGTSKPPVETVAFNDRSASLAPREKLQPIISRLATNPKLHGVIATFIQRLDKQLRDMETAYKKGNLEDLALLAHWLKGAGGTVGYDELTEPAAELVDFAKQGEIEAAGRMLKKLQSMAIAIVPPGGTDDHMTTNEFTQTKPDTAGNWGAI